MTRNGKKSQIVFAGHKLVHITGTLKMLKIQILSVKFPAKLNIK